MVRWHAMAVACITLASGSKTQAQTQPAVLTIGVGETYDFEFAPVLPRDLLLRAVDPRGLVRLSALVRVTAPGR